MYLSIINILLPILLTSWAMAVPANSPSIEVEPQVHKVKITQTQRVTPRHKYRRAFACSAIFLAGVAVVSALIWQKPSSSQIQSRPLAQVPQDVFSLIVEQLCMNGDLNAIQALARTSRATRDIVNQAFDSRPHLKFFRRYYQLTNNRDQQYPIPKNGDLDNFTLGEPHELSDAINSLDDLTNILHKLIHRVEAKKSQGVLAPGFIVYQDVPTFARYLTGALQKSGKNSNDLRRILRQLPLVIVAHDIDEQTVLDLSHVNVLSAFGHLSIKQLRDTQGTIDAVSNIFERVNCPSVSILDWFLPIADKITSPETHTLCIDSHYNGRGMTLPNLSPHIEHIILATYDRSNQWGTLVDSFIDIGQNSNVKTLRFLHGYDRQHRQERFLQAVLSQHQVKKIMIHPERIDIPIDQNFYLDLYKNLKQHKFLQEIRFYSPATELNYHRAHEILPPLIKGQVCPQFKYIA
jgi:hypothetical protein